MILRQPTRYFLLLLISLSLSGGLSAQELSTPAKIKKQILEWSRRLNQHAKEKDRLANLVWSLDSSIQAQQELIQQTNTAIQTLDNRRLQTQQSIDKLKGSQAKLLSTYLQSLNLQSHFERRRYIPLVTSPLRTEERRLMQYYSYYQTAIHETLQQQAKDCEALVVLNVQIAHEQGHYKALLEQQESQLAALKTLQDKRTSILAELQSTFVVEKKQVSQLQSKLDALNQSLIKTQRQHHQFNEKQPKSEFLEEAKDHVNFASDNKIPNVKTAPKSLIGPFKALKGKLQWPLAQHHPVVEKDPIHPGTRLIAPAGSAVRAIHHGTVVYADSLKGLGLLVILDHGQGYMSLYGDNESLYVKTGDTIKANDLIGRVGIPGTVNHSSLYLEIRKDGKPLHVPSWFMPS